MKSYIKTLLKTTVSLALIVSIVGSSIGIDNINVKAKNNDLEKKYIIITENKRAYEKTIDTVREDEVISEDNILEDNIIIADITESEAEYLNKDTRIIVEEDAVLEANGVKRKHKEKTELYEQLN